MSYCVSHMIGIRTGGVFSGDVDYDDLRTRIANIRDRECPSVPISVAGAALSVELHGSKGSYVMIAGVFNYWTWTEATEFARRLSKEFSTEVLHMCWDEEQNEMQCQMYLDGDPFLDVAEHPLGRILRRIS